MLLLLQRSTSYTRMQWAMSVRCQLKANMLLSTNSCFMFSTVCSVMQVSDSSESQQESRQSPDKTSECMRMYVRDISISTTQPPPTNYNFMGNNYEDSPHNNSIEISSVLFSAMHYTKIGSFDPLLLHH